MSREQKEASLQREISSVESEIADLIEQSIVLQEKYSIVEDIYEQANTDLFEMTDQMETIASTIRNKEDQVSIIEQEIEDLYE